MKNRDLFLALGFIIIGFAYRLIPNHPPNATPVAAMALVGGMYLNRRVLAFLAPIVALYLGDLILNNTINRGFFPGQEGMILWNNYMVYSYGAFLLTVLLGIVLLKKSTGMKIIAGGLISSMLFFLVTNFGSWLTLPMYPKTPAGLILCYEAAIPFFRNTLIGNMIFVTLFVGAIELIKNSSFLKLASPVRS